VAYYPEFPCWVSRIRSVYTKPSELEFSERPLQKPGPVLADGATASHSAVGNAVKSSRAYKISKWRKRLRDPIVSWEAWICGF
jgi:hypothetical protein